MSERVELPAGWPNCACGCGRPVPPVKHSNPERGLVVGQPHKYCSGHQGRGDGGDEKRFWSRVDRSDPDGCWPWTAGKSKGYGSLTIGGKTVISHRVAYEWLVGPIPQGMHIDHLCRNRACVNPAHLEPVTPRENLLRGEGITARNARATHCKKGHPLTGDNVYRSPNYPQGRACRTCRRLWRLAREGKAAIEKAAPDGGGGE